MLYGQKVRVLGELRSGKSYSAVGCELSVNASTMYVK